LNRHRNFKYTIPNRLLNLLKKWLDLFCQLVLQQKFQKPFLNFTEHIFTIYKLQIERQGIFSLPFPSIFSLAEIYTHTHVGAPIAGYAGIIGYVSMGYPLE
jgi:hypothetical protein